MRANVTAEIINHRKQMWKRYRDCHGDPLALRALTLATHGWQTLHNMVRLEHGRAKRY